MRILSLRSGSNGNAIYVESTTTGASVLLDCGISRLRIEQSLKINGRSLANVGGVFVTHEHGDHVAGLPVVTRRFGTPVHITRPTFQACWEHRSIRGAHFIANDAVTEVEDIVIRAFPKSHDAVDPVFFTVECDGQRFLYATDLGIQDRALLEQLNQSDAALLEFNYDHGMLMNGDYPPHLKARVDSNRGHLSNSQACDILAEACDGRLRLLMPGHISDHNNTHDHVLTAIRALLQRSSTLRPDVVIASRYELGDMVEVGK